MTIRYSGKGSRWYIIGLGLLLAIAATGAGVLAEDDATFDLTKDIPTAIKLTKEAYDEGDTTGEENRFVEMTRYGNWYGPGWSGGTEGGEKPGNKQPVDALDAVAMKHDFGYQYAEEQGRLHGKEYEYLLKAMADEIAVRDVKRLDDNPRSWTPPPTDPDEANRYRKRLQFGFKYWAKQHQLRGDAVTVASAFKYVLTRTGLPKIDQATLEAEVAKRTQAWFEREDVRPMYRIELRAPKSLLEEWEKVTITARVVPVENQHQAMHADAVSTPVNLIVSGRAELSSYTIVSGGSVILTATRRWYHLTSGNGKTISVTAELKDAPYDLQSNEITFTVAAKSHMALTADPQAINEWPEAGSDANCPVMTFRARVTDSEGKGISEVSVGFTRNDGAKTDDATTDADGVATKQVYVCQSELGDEQGKSYTWTARMTSTTAADGTVYVPSTATALVTLTQPKIYVARGRVVDEMRNFGVAGATVTVSGPGGPRSATTDANGNYAISIPGVWSEPPEGWDGSVTKTGYSEATFTLASFTLGAMGPSQTIRISPLAATVVGRVMDAGTKPGEGGLLDGATVRVTQPFEKLIFTQGGEFTIVDLFVGDTLTMTADAVNHKAYTKSGKITMENVSITFRLPAGKGTASGGLEETEATEEEMDESLPVYHSLMVWASPADPASFQAVTVTAQIFPPEPGVLVEISMHGTDGYSTSTTAMTNAMGKVFLHIPGAKPGVVDDIVARIIGERVRVIRQLKYSF